MLFNGKRLLTRWAGAAPVRVLGFVVWSAIVCACSSRCPLCDLGPAPCPSPHISLTVSLLPQSTSSRDVYKLMWPFLLWGMLLAAMYGVSYASFASISHGSISVKLGTARRHRSAVWRSMLERRRWHR